MQITDPNLTVWTHSTDASYNASRTSTGAFLTAEQQARLERIRQARLLFDGKHRQYFLDEGRTQFDFPPVRAGDKIVQLYITHNVLGLISQKSADLLFGEEPLIRSDVPRQQKAIDDLVKRCNLHALLQGAAVDCSCEAETFLEAVIREGQVYLRKIQADKIFPLGDLLPDGQYGSYASFEVKNVGTKDRPLWVLLTTQWLPGKITRQLQQLTDNGAPSGRELSLDQWPLPAGADPLLPEMPTGIQQNTITWIPNLLLRERPVSDYDGSIDLQDSLNAKNSQVARVLAQHADPKLAMPQSAADADGNVRSDFQVRFFGTKEEIPQYITWKAELEQAIADRGFVLNQLLVRTETSPVLLGLKEGAAPDAYKKVRLESFNSLTKAARKATYWKAGIRRAVAVALDLENTLPGVRYDRTEIAVQLRDGIPSDSKDDAERQLLLTGAGLMSRRRAIQEQLNDPAAVEKELAELDEQNKHDMPTALLGEPVQAGTAGAGTEAVRQEGTQGDPSSDPAQAEPQPAGDNQAAAVAGNDLRGTVGALNAVRDLQIAYYSREIPREAAIANAKLLLGFTDEDAAGLFPDIAPNAPSDPDPAVPAAAAQEVPL
jgi:hypothetical protein